MLLADWEEMTRFMVRMAMITYGAMVIRDTGTEMVAMTKLTEVMETIISGEVAEMTS